MFTMLSLYLVKLATFEITDITPKLRLNCFFCNNFVHYALILFILSLVIRNDFFTHLSKKFPPPLTVHINCNRVFILVYSENILVKSILICLQRLLQYGEFNFCGSFGPPCMSCLNVCIHSQKGTFLSYDHELGLMTLTLELGLVRLWQTSIPNIQIKVLQLKNYTKLIDLLLDIAASTLTLFIRHQKWHPAYRKVAIYLLSNRWLTKKLQNCLHLCVCLIVQCVDAFGWAAGRASGLQKKLSGWYWRGYLSRERCRFAYGPADATATHCLLLQ